MAVFVEASDDDDVAWSLVLDVFGVGLIAAVVVCAVIWTVSDKNLAEGLPDLPTSAWKAGDSWLANVTIGTAVIATLSGSSGLATALFDANERNAMLVVTIMAAGGIAIAGLVASLDTAKSGDGKARFLTFGGLLTSVFLTLMSAFSELWLIGALVLRANDAPTAVEVIVISLTTVTALVIFGYCTISTKTLVDDADRSMTQSRLP